MRGRDYRSWKSATLLGGAGALLRATGAAHAPRTQEPGCRSDASGVAPAPHALDRRFAAVLPDPQAVDPRFFARLPDPRAIDPGFIRGDDPRCKA